MHLIATGNMSFHANSLQTIFSRDVRLLDAQADFRRFQDDLQIALVNLNSMLQAEDQLVLQVKVA